MTAPPKKTIDIVVPVRNEQASIPLFVRAVNGLEIPESVSIGIIFVEDSSVDDTRRILRNVSAAFRNVSYYRLKTGFGEGAAVMFGMERSDADAVITMETGGGHPVGAVSELISRHLAGAEIVQAVRVSYKNRKLYRSAGAAAFNILLKLLAGFDPKEQNVYFRLLSRKHKNILMKNRRFSASLRFKLPTVDVCRVDKVYFHAEDGIDGKSEYDFMRLAGVSLDFMLAVIPLPRLCFLLLGLLSLFFILASHGNLGAAGVSALCAIGISLRSWKLWNNEILEKIKVTEQHVYLNVRE